MRRSAARRGARRAAGGSGRRHGADRARPEAGHRVPVRAAAGLRRRVGDGAPRRGHAAGHRPRRARAAARRPGAGEPGVPHRGAARPGGHPARHASPTSTPGVIEQLFAADLAFLQDLYRRVNQEGHTRAGVTCPECQHTLRRRPRGWPPGGIVTYAADTLYDEVAYVAFHFGWSRAEILDLEHAERIRYVAQIDRLVGGRRPGV